MIAAFQEPRALAARIATELARFLPTDRAAERAAGIVAPWSIEGAAALGHERRDQSAPSLSVADFVRPALSEWLDGDVLEQAVDRVAGVLREGVPGLAEAEGDVESARAA